MTYPCSLPPVIETGSGKVSDKVIYIGHTQFRFRCMAVQYKTLYGGKIGTTQGEDIASVNQEILTSESSLQEKEGRGNSA